MHADSPSCSSIKLIQNILVFFWLFVLPIYRPIDILELAVFLWLCFQSHLKETMMANTKGGKWQRTHSGGYCNDVTSYLAVYIVMVAGGLLCHYTSDSTHPSPPHTVKPCWHIHSVMHHRFTCLTVCRSFSTLSTKLIQHRST